MQDPHVDIAMFGIYSLYNKEQIDKLIQTYFKGNCDNDIKIKIYCYISVCRSINTSPLTSISALGFSYEIGAKRLDRPAAIIIALST